MSQVLASRAAPIAATSVAAAVKRQPQPQSQSQSQSQSKDHSPPCRASSSSRVMIPTKLNMSMFRDLFKLWSSADLTPIVTKNKTKIKTAQKWTANENEPATEDTKEDADDDNVRIITQLVKQYPCFKPRRLKAFFVHYALLAIMSGTRVRAHTCMDLWHEFLYCGLNRRIPLWGLLA